MAIITKAGKSPAELHGNLGKRPEKNVAPAQHFPGLNPQQIESMTNELMRKKKLDVRAARALLSKTCVEADLKAQADKDSKRRPRPETAAAPGPAKSETAAAATAGADNNKPDPAKPGMGAKVMGILGLSGAKEGEGGEQAGDNA